MIRDLDEILGRDNGMRGQIAGFTLAGILEGVVFALMIPILKAVVRGDYDAAVPWVVTAALSGGGLWRRTVDRRESGVPHRNRGFCRWNHASPR